VDSISFPERKEKWCVFGCVFVDKLMKLGSYNSCVSLSYTRSGLISNKCWLYLNLLKITSCTEPYWHTKTIILADVYTHAFLSHTINIKNVHTTIVYSSNPDPTPLQGFMYRRNYKLTYFCVTYLQYRTAIQKTWYSRNLLVPHLYYKGSYLLYMLKHFYDTRLR